jgi:PAS domain S-box-containing protein
MRTVIIGGGKGCRAIIDLAQGGFLRELVMKIICVVDPDPNARGLQYAKEIGILTSSDMHEAINSISNIELIIELTGNNEVLESLYKIIPPGAALIDHTFAHIFWDLVNAQEDQLHQLLEITALEKKIEKEQHFLQSIFDDIPDAILVLDRDKKAIKVNASFGEFVGIKPKQTLGKTCDELLAKTEFDPETRQTAPLLDKILATGESHSTVWRTEPPEEAYWEVSLTPIVDRDSTINAILAIWHRITEKVRLRREIESAELRFKSFIDSAHDWISIKDLDERYLIVNPVIARAFHHNVEDFIGKRPDEILPPDLAKTIMSHDQQVIKTNRHHSYKELIPIDGRDHYFQTVRFPLTDYRGSAIGICTIMRDVTSEKQLGDQLVQAAKLVAVGQLAAGVAHEINNPLTGILAYAEDMIDDFPIGSEHREDLKVIIRETMRCRDIVRNLLNFARQEDPKLETVNPNEVVKQSLLLIEKLPQFRNIVIERKINERIPDIKGDPRQLQQVVLNLMLNAADAMKEKGIIVLLTEYDRRHDKCIISVQDNGPGIPENLIDKIFEPFFSTKGTNGLGLAVCWGIVERHRGIIEVDMPEGGGAAFNVIIPASSGNN